MNVQVKGTKQEEVWITISTKELLNTIKGFIKKDGSEWIAESKNENGLLAIWEDTGGSHYHAEQIRELSEADTKFYRAYKVIEEYLNVLDAENDKEIMNRYAVTFGKQATKGKGKV